jgi:hypothetical protein
MLGTDYSELLRVLMTQVPWNIDLPGDRDRFFRETGHIAAIPEDERRSPRFRLRSPCLLIPEDPLPAFPRNREPIAIYTADISRHGIGFVAATQFLPEEKVRIILPMFWLQATIVRGRRLGPQCYQGSALLMRKHPPELAAFDGMVTPR